MKLESSVVCKAIARILQSAAHDTVWDALRQCARTARNCSKRYVLSPCPALHIIFPHVVPTKPDPFRACAWRCLAGASSNRVHGRCRSTTQTLYPRRPPCSNFPPLTCRRKTVQTRWRILSVCIETGESIRSSRPLQTRHYRQFTWEREESRRRVPHGGAPTASKSASFAQQTSPAQQEKQNTARRADWATRRRKLRYLCRERF